MPFPVKALKILVRELQSGGESATVTARGGVVEDLESDDGVGAFPCLTNAPYLFSDA